MLFYLLQAGLDSADIVSQTAAVVPHEEKMRLLDMAFKGGWLMLVLLALSILAIYIFGKKWWMIHQAGSIDDNFMRDIRDYIHEGKLKSAVSLCERYDSPVARLVEKGISRIGRPLSDIQTAIENTGNTEVARLEKGLPILATIAGGAPMIGFLGTVIGMVMSFDQIQQAGDISPTIVASGMKVALITTIFGIIVALILQVFYNYILSKVEHLTSQMEESAVTLMDIIAKNK